MVEAADDICYCIVDLEDGFRSNRLDYRKLQELLTPIAFAHKVAGTTKTFENIKDERNRAEYLRATAIGNLVTAVAAAFIENKTALLDGTLEESLIARTPFAQQMEAIKRCDFECAYSAPRVLQIEAAGFEIISGLLGKFVPALLAKKPTSAQKKLQQLMPPQCLLGNTTYERLLLATDFIAGMTDTFAIRTHRRLSGMELPGA